MIKPLCIFSLLFLAIFSWQFTCSHDENAWKRIPRIYLSSSQILAPTLHNFSLIVNPDDHTVANKILSQGTWELQNIVLIASIVKKSHKVINIGSQYGLQAIIMGKIIDQKGKLYAFQPSSSSYKFLVKNIYINNLQSQTITYRLACGQSNGLQNLLIVQENTGHSHIAESIDDKDQYEEVEITRVDRIINQKIDFALIDTQSFESKVLLGMSEIIKHSKSLIMLVEWSFKETNRISIEMAINLFKAHNFRLFRYIYDKSNSCLLGKVTQLQMEQLFKIRQQDVIIAGPEANIEHLF